MRWGHHCSIAFKCNAPAYSKNKAIEKPNDTEGSGKFESNYLLKAP